jgi:hypothetical protein
MLDSFAKVGSAPDAGANYASGFETAIKEFDLIRALDKKAGDTTAKEYFIVLFADGNFRGDKGQLTKMEEEMTKRQIHLLVVGMGEQEIVDVPKYDVTTHQRNGTFEGQTQLQPAQLQEMQKAVPGADLLWAPPGTEHLHYNFPSKAGGLYAVPHDSNLYPWFLIIGLLALLNVTITGGRVPKLRHIMLWLEPVRRLRRFLPSRQSSGHN